MENKDNLRINLVYSFFALLFVVIGIRIFYLQILQNPFLKNLASRQYYRLVPLEGRRGDIFDRTGKVLATGMNSYSVFADPVMVKDAGKTAGILAANLSLPAGEIYRKLAKNKKGRFVWIKRKVSWFDKERIKKINLKGIGFIREEKRFYPQEMLASSVLGIVDVDNKGLEGMEVFYDNYLRGKNGIVRVLQDSHCREIIVSPQVITPQEGSDIVLTIDAQLQYWVENYLAETVRKFAASAGSVVVMDATTGEILSLANYPAFDPNSIDAASAKYLKNRAVCDMFEPGSVFKIVTLIAALDTKRYGETDTFF
jgi:cell division protein FtsI (penicillin-binding protein 3)